MADRVLVYREWFLYEDDAKAAVAQFGPETEVRVQTEPPWSPLNPTPYVVWEVAAWRRTTSLHVTR